MTPFLLRMKRGRTPRDDEEGWKRRKQLLREQTFRQKGEPPREGWMNEELVDTSRWMHYLIGILIALYWQFWKGECNETCSWKRWTPPPPSSWLRWKAIPPYERFTFLLLTQQSILRPREIRCCEKWSGWMSIGLQSERWLLLQSLFLLPVAVLKNFWGYIDRQDPWPWTLSLISNSTDCVPFHSSDWWISLFDILDPPDSMWRRWARSVRCSENMRVESGERLRSFDERAEVGRRGLDPTSEECRERVRLTLFLGVGPYPYIDWVAGFGRWSNDGVERREAENETMRIVEIGYDSICPESPSLSVTSPWPFAPSHLLSDLPCSYWRESKVDEVVERNERSWPLTL